MLSSSAATCIRITAFAIFVHLAVLVLGVNATKLGVRIITKSQNFNDNLAEIKAELFLCGGG